MMNTPFSSPKDKHLKMKNGKDFRKINHGEYGAINFNNMIPVVTEAVVPFDFNDVEDEKLTAYEKQIKQRCCDLKKLEEVMKKYGE